MNIEDTVLKAYSKYAHEMVDVWPEAENFRNRITTMYENLTCEVLYCLARDSKPEYVLEMSPHHGWSTYFLVSALMKNGNCKKIYSYDLLDIIQLPDHMKTLIEFKQGDAKETVKKDIVQKCSFFFIDSDHDTPEFVNWYRDLILDNMPSGSMVLVDDIFHTYRENDPTTENRMLLPYLSSKKIPYLTFAKKENPEALAKILEIRETTPLKNISRDTVYNRNLSPIYFRNIP